MRSGKIYLSTNGPSNPTRDLMPQDIDVAVYRTPDSRYTDPCNEFLGLGMEYHLWVASVCFFKYPAVTPLPGIPFGVCAIQNKLCTNWQRSGPA